LNVEESFTNNFPFFSIYDQFFHVISEDPQSFPKRIVSQYYYVSHKNSYWTCSTYKLLYDIIRTKIENYYFQCQKLKLKFINFTIIKIIPNLHYLT